MEVRKFKITVEGKTFEVDVEEIGEVKNTEVSSSQTRQKKEIKQPVIKNISSGSGKAIISPMPGKIIEIKVSVGDSIKAGDTLLIMEAMKMEQEVKSTVDGIVESIMVTENETVRKNQEMITIN